jgi:carbonic anhydrase/acetyltransferase-like protein (isoleucine patch superfamily)
MASLLSLIESCVRSWGRKDKSKARDSQFQETRYRNLKAHKNIELVLDGRHYFRGLKIQNDGPKKCPEKVSVSIGDGFHCGPRCEIRTSDHNHALGYPMVHGSMAGYVAAPVHIGKNVWLGNDVLIMKGVSIGDGAIIQARSVVVSDIPDLAIAGGHPCRVFAYRNKALYEALCEKGWQHQNVNENERESYVSEIERLIEIHGPAFTSTKK